MKISILLPYKENFSPEYPGAVSIFLNSVIKVSKYKKFITVYGNTSFKKKYNINYKNIDISKKILGLGSQTSTYIRNYVKLENKRPSDIIEVHNRPAYIQLLPRNKTKKVLYFHNDPLSMNGSRSTKERIDLLSICAKIVFNSEWSKNRFLSNLDEIYIKSQKLIVIRQSANRQKVNLRNKKNIITFVGKLNKAKGYDIFGSAIIEVLNRHKNWEAVVIGDEEREKIHFNHKRLKLLGFKNHKDVIKIFKKSSISVVCSRWEEPFGRTSLESASCGCAVIITNRGGLPETITNGIILNKLNKNEVFKSLNHLILNTNYRKEIQSLSLKNFNLTHINASQLIDKYRYEINSLDNQSSAIKKLKILHVTNFNERHNGRLFYNTGKRINNGFIRLKHSVLEFSDRDIVSYYRKINDLDGSKRLNKKFIEVISNYLPDIIVFGHADLIKRESILFIKKTFPNIKFCQWFLDRMDTKWINNLNRFRHKYDLMDANFCTSDPKNLNFKKDKPIFYLPNPVDESFEKLKNYENNYLNNDVFFAMSHGVHRGILKKGKFDEREIFIEKLKKLTPNIKYDLYGMENNQPVWADNFINKISNSKMGLNLSQGKPVKYYSSDRFAQLIGNGLLVFIDEKTKINDHLNSKEIVTYKNLKDLAKKIIKFNKDDRLRKVIAKKGRDKYHKFFNSEIIAKFIVSKTLNIKTKRFYWEK
jgi:glycosyltransferase involved in cell wall biosynthesis